MKTFYRDAALGRRTADFYAPEVGPLAALIANGQRLRARSRALMRQNSWALNAREQFASQAVGKGITPTFQSDDEDWNREAKMLWGDWVKEADAAGLYPFPGLQYQVASEIFEAGEIFIRLRQRLPEDDLTVPLQLQLLEPERVPWYYTMPLPNGGYIKAGIEFDPIGRRAAYWMYPNHPGEFFALPLDSLQLRRIPASEIVHVFKPGRAEAVRGAPWLTTVLLRLAGLDDYDDAELERKKGVATIAGVITCLDAEKASERVGDLHEESTNVAVVNMEPGSWPILGPGEDIHPMQPADVGPNYGPFHEMNLRAVAAAAGLPYSMLTGDLRGANYSSLRTGMLDFRRRMEPFQHQILAHQLCRPVLLYWLDLAMQSGALRNLGLKRRREYRRVSWIPPVWPWVDPAKEVGAAVEERRAGLTSRTRQIAERTGEDAAVIEAEIAAEDERADTRTQGGPAIYDSDPRRVGKPATGKTAQAEETQATAADDSAAAADASVDQATGTNG